MTAYKKAANLPPMKRNDSMNNKKNLKFKKLRNFTLILFIELVLTVALTILFDFYVLGFINGFLAGAIGLVLHILRFYFIFSVSKIKVRKLARVHIPLLIMWIGAYQMSLLIQLLAIISFINDSLITVVGFALIWIGASYVFDIWMLSPIKMDA